VTGTAIAAVVGDLRAAGCVFAEEEAQLLITAAGSSADLDAMVRRRVAGEPLEQIVGWAEFCGLRIVVEPGVFVPRSRTALLVRAAAALLRPRSIVVDLGCGAGAIGAALRHECDIELLAVDIDPAAVRCAERNLGPSVRLGDLYDALPAGWSGRVDVIVANTPYVPTDAIGLMPPEARDHEHRVALDGGADGLTIARRVAAGASAWLAPGGHVLVETSEEQAPVLAATMADHGLAARIERDDDIDGTVVIGRN
jgi:release factor glutamine methyltransferase